MKATVVNIRRDRETCDVNIGRRGPWGNPYSEGPLHGNRAEVLRKYEAWLRQNWRVVRDARRELRGKVLGCYCKPLACHGDVLARYVNARRIRVVHSSQETTLRRHYCHNPACRALCHPSRLFCRACWRRVPPDLQRKVWRTYNRGQENGTAPVTREWLKAARAAINSL